MVEVFEDRIIERKLGILVKKWATLMEILSHESTSVFLSHCSWNLVWESLSEGVPIIGWLTGNKQARHGLTSPFCPPLSQYVASVLG